MKKSILALLGSVYIFTVPAMSADLAVVPSYKAPSYSVTAPGWSWTGFYMGVTGGYGWNDTDIRVGGRDPISSALVASGFVPPILRTANSGPLGGVTAGFNMQAGNIVYGIEADISYADLTGSDTQRLAIGPFALTTTGTQTTNWLATARLRVGAALGQALVYVTGGLAVADVEASTRVALTGIPGIPAAVGSASKTAYGWTAGLGIEAALNRSWSLKGEALYYDVGDLSYVSQMTAGGVTVGFNNTAQFQGWVTRLGLNYRF